MIADQSLGVNLNRDCFEERIVSPTLIHGANKNDCFARPSTDDSVSFSFTENVVKQKRLWKQTGSNLCYERASRAEKNKSRKFKIKKREIQKKKRILKKDDLKQTDEFEEEPVLDLTETLQGNIIEKKEQARQKEILAKQSFYIQPETYAQQNPVVEYKEDPFSHLKKKNFALIAMSESDIKDSDLENIDTNALTQNSKRIFCPFEEFKKSKRRTDRIKFLKQRRNKQIKNMVKHHQPQIKRYVSIYTALEKHFSSNLSKSFFLEELEVLIKPVDRPLTLDDLAVIIWHSPEPISHEWIFDPYFQIHDKIVFTRTELRFPSKTIQNKVREMRTLLSQHLLRYCINQVHSRSQNFISEQKKQNAELINNLIHNQRRKQPAVCLFPEVLNKQKTDEIFHRSDLSVPTISRQIATHNADMKELFNKHKTKDEIEIEENIQLLLQQKSASVEQMRERIYAYVI